MENNEDVSSADGEQKNVIDDEVIPPSTAKELSEEEINSIRLYIGKEFESQEEVYNFYNR
ncbi:hypothetical protein MKW98_030443, partial [Papaver atlanticum]